MKIESWVRDRACPSSDTGKSIERNVKQYCFIDRASHDSLDRSSTFFLQLQAFNSFSIVSRHFSLPNDANERMKEHWPLRVSKFLCRERWTRAFLGFSNRYTDDGFLRRIRLSSSSTNVRWLTNSCWVFGYSDASASVVRSLIFLFIFQPYLLE